MSGRWRTLRRLIERGLIVLSLAYPACLLLVWLLLRFVGESWWLTGLGMYLPRWGFGLPLPVLTLGLLWARRRRWLATQALALLIVLFPLMGLELNVWPASKSKPAGIRVLSMNVNQGYFGYDQVAQSVLEYAPDVVLLQEAILDKTPLLMALSAKYPTVANDDQFVFASRFPLVEKNDPGRIPYFDKRRSPRSMRYVLDTPLGRVAFLSLHPLSPREATWKLRGERGFRRELTSGRFFRGEAAPAINYDNQLRVLQVKVGTELIERDPYPKVIAGDTNLPGLSPAFADYLSKYQDGFDELGFGFGYTYPRKLPWMRIDRILASDELRFTSFEIGCSGVSDHLCVVAELELAN